MGFVKDDEPIDADAVVAYCRSFQGPVPQSKLSALSELFPDMDWEEVVDVAVEPVAI